MTMTPPLSAARAARLPGPRAALATALAAVLAAGGLLLPAAVAAASVAGPPPTEPLAFQVAADAEGIVRDDGDLTVAISVDNPTSSTVRAGSVALAVSREPLTTRAAVADWLAGESEPALRGVGSEPLDSIAAHGTSTASTVVAVGDDLDPGVYALRGSYDSAQGTLLSRGVWVVPDDEDAGDVAVVVPITAGPLTAGMLTADELEALTAPGGSLREQLDAVAGTAAVLAVDPAVVAAVRVLGTAAPDTATEWLDDLLTLPNSRFALQWGDADLAAQFAAGVDDPLQVPTLAPWLDATGFQGGGTEPTPTPGATGVELPDVAALTDIGSARGNVFWPAGGTAGADVVAAIARTAGGAASLTLVPSDTVRGERGAAAVSGDADLLVYDAAVSRALRDASASDLRIERSGSLAEASAYATFARTGAPLLVTVDRADDRSTTALRSAIRAASRLDGRTPVSIGALAMTPDSAPVVVDEIDPDDARTSALERFLEDEEELDRFATILTDPTVLTAPERAAILQLIGNAWQDQAAEWADAVDDHGAATATTLDAVGIVPSPDINLLGASAPLTFSVRNDLPWPATLTLITEPNDPRLVVQTITEVAAGALQTTRVDVPVQARVGTGESSLDLQLRSPVMVPIGDRVTVEVSVSAEWETVVIIVMSVLVTALIAAGVVRTVLRIRRRSGAPETAAEERADG